MAVANENAIKYAELTDEHIKDIKKGIEMFVGSEEYWDRFANHSAVPRGHKVFTYRRLIAPHVKPEDIRPRAELVAPRPAKIAVATFEKTVQNYGDKFIYTKEDLQFHFDDTVKNARATLQEIAVQKKDIIKGKAFFQSRAIISPVSVNGSESIIATAENAAIILRKNKAKRWDGTHYLAHITPEGLKKLRAELDARGASLTEDTKGKLENVLTAVGSYGDFTYSVTTSELMYKNDTTQYIVFMGKRGIDGKSPVDVSKLEGESDIQVINNPLGSGVLVDEDGNYTSDDNKQQGSVAINIDGLGSVVSDDLCILDCEFSIDVIKGTALPLASQTNYVSHSGNEVEATLTAGSNTEFILTGFRHDTTASKDYASGNTIVSVQVVAATGKTLGTVNANNWTVTYKNLSGEDAITADVLAVTKTVKANDTVIIKVPNNASVFTITSAATASN